MKPILNNNCLSEKELIHDVEVTSVLEVVTDFRTSVHVHPTPLPLGRGTCLSIEFRSEPRPVSVG